MKSNPKQRRSGRWLLAIGREISALIREKRKGNLPRVRHLDDWWDTYTDGWAVTLGDLGKGQPLLEIFYCRFAGHKDRKLWAGLSSYRGDTVSPVVKDLPKHLFAVKEFTDADLGHGEFAALKRRLEPARQRRDLNLALSS